MAVLVVVLCALVGLAVGSFLNVVIWRVPRGESIVHPPSACPGCGHPIRWRDNVPVLGWLLLRGRCRDCAEPVSVRYPLVEAGTGLAFAGVAAWSGPTWHLPAFLYLAAVSIALALIDIDCKRLPDPIVLPSYIVGAALLIPAILLGENASDVLIRTGVGLVALFLFYFLTWLVGVLVLGKVIMGLGDVKLAGVLGMYLGFVGWKELVAGSFFAFLVGGVVGIALMAAGQRKIKVPFGPYMIIGAWLGVFVGGPAADLYFRVVGLS